MKCTWPMHKFCVWDPTQPLSQQLVLGFCIGGNANCKIRVQGKAKFSIFRYQHAGISNAKFRVGGLSQYKDPTQMDLHSSGI